MSNGGLRHRSGIGREKFPRSSRLRGRKIFRDLLSGGEKISSPFFFIRHFQNEAESPRLGIVVPKKIFHRVVDRNRLKRLARESFRRAASALPGHDYLIYYKAEALRIEGVLLARRLRDFWARISE